MNESKRRKLGFWELYDAQGGVLHSKSAAGRRVGDEAMVAAAWEAAGEEDRASWTVESPEGASEPAALLQERRAGYCSFIVHGEAPALAQLPFPEDLVYGDATWVFCCVPHEQQETKGRPEHLDSVLHAGTVHVQVSGRKSWFVRHREATEVIRYDLEAGDVFALDTKNWFHCTSIPAGGADASISVARDIYRSEEDKEEQADTMTNVEAAYATEDIEEGTLLFTSDECPDIQLGVSSDPNCQLVELDDELTGVVSIKDIAAGDFLCVAE